MSLRHLAFLAPLPLLLACSKDAPPAQADATGKAAPALSAAASAITSAAAPSASAKTAAAASAKARSTKAPISAADRKKALALLQEGRKKSRAKDFTAALTAFDQALALTPDDVAVLSEVGWAALNAGELDRADKANKRALALVKQPVQRAQILYNAGRVAEAKKDTEAARKAYAESLSLRDNAEVKKRLDAAGGPPEPMLPCAAGAPTVEALCKCLLKPENAPMMPDDAKTVCEVEKTLPLGDARLSVLRYGAEMMGEVVHLLVAKDGSVLRPVAGLGSDYEPGAFGVHNEAHVLGGEAKTFGSRTVIVVKSEQRDFDQNMAGLEICDESNDYESVCALGSGAAPSRCFTVPVSIAGGCGAGVEPDPADLDDDTKKSLEEMKKSWSHSAVKLSWSLGPDGKVEVKKVSGESKLIPAGLVGAHALAP
ncbi:MAG: tetratricopeptide repeat protein [Byssovorax sp.]